MSWPDPPAAEQLDRATDQSFRDELAELKARLEETLSEIACALREGAGRWCVSGPAVSRGFGVTSGASRDERGRGAA